MPRVSAGEIRPGTGAYELMRGIGNLCIGRDSDPSYDPRRLVDLLLQSLQRLGRPRRSHRADQPDR